MGEGAVEEEVALHDSVCKGIEGFMQCHLRTHNVADNGRFPVRVKGAFMEFSCERIKGKIISKELILIVFDPIVYFDILEGHEDIPNFVFIHDFALVEVGVEILNELSEDGRGDGTHCEDWSGFLSVMEFDCHLVL